jgi:hypothetical protein
MTDMTAEEILERMLHVFDEKDWIQDGMWAPDSLEWVNDPAVTGVCLEGAFCLARGAVNLSELGPEFSHKFSHWPDINRTLQTVITDLFPDREPVPFLFNDNPYTTLEDVKLVIKTALERTVNGTQ